MNNIQSVLYYTNLDRLIAFVRISRRELNPRNYDSQLFTSIRIFEILSFDLLITLLMTLVWELLK
jgi:hypothetical protein